MIKSWYNKFACAFSGLFWALRTQSSCWVHVTMTVAVVVVAVAVGVELWQWSVLLLTIGAVISAELFNTAIEELVNVLHPEHDERIGRVLDISAGAVLVVSIASVAVGLVVLGPSILDRLFQL